MQSRSVGTRCARLLAVLACALLCALSLVAPGLASAAQSGDFTYEVNDAGTAEITSYTGNEEVLTVPSELDGYSVTALRATAMSGNKALKSVTIPEGVTALGDSLFASCTSLEEVVLPSTLADLGEGTFVKCAALKSLTIPEGVSTIGKYLFQGCTSLSTVFVTASVTSIEEHAFADCSSDVALIGPHGCAAETLAAELGVTFKHTVSFTANGGSQVADAYVTCGGTLDEASVETPARDGYRFDGWYSDPKLTKAYDFTAAVGDDTELFAKWQIEYELKSVDGGVVITGYTGSASDLVIPAQIDGQDILGIDAGAFKGNMDVDYVSFAEGSKVSYIGDSAFEGSGVRKVALCQGVTSIGARAFADCLFLSEAGLPEGLTSVGDSAFEGDLVLSYAGLPSTVTSIGGKAFYNCKALEGINLPDGLASIGDKAFVGCTKLTSVTLPSSIQALGNGQDSVFEESGVQSVTLSEGWTSVPANAFKGCDKLTSVTLPASVASIGQSAFQGCAALAAIELPEGLSGIGSQAFASCAALTSVTVPAATATVGASAFEGCTSLATVGLSQGIVSIGDAAFKDCEALTSIDLPEGLTAVGESAFAGCAALERASIPSTLTAAGSADKPAFAGSGLKTASVATPTVPTVLFKGCTQLTGVTFAEGVTAIGDYAFEGCTALEGIDIPAGVTAVGAYAFKDCSALSSIGLVDGLATVGEGAFQGCAALESVTLPKTLTTVGSDEHPAFYGSAVKSATFAEGTTAVPAYAFQGCTALTSVTLPEGLATIGEQAFKGCTALNGVELPEGLGTVGGRAFLGCTGLTVITIPAGTEVEHYAFEKCTSLASLTIAEGATTLGIGAFTGCTALTDLVVPSQVLAVGDGAFEDCIGLESVSFQGGTSIGSGAFQDCANLSTLSIEKGAVSSIGSYAFHGCASLVDVTLPEGVASLGKLAFGGCTSMRSLHVPASLTSFGDDVFEGGTSVKIFGPRVCEGRTWAQNEGLSYTPDTALVTYQTNGGSAIEAVELEYGEVLHAPTADPTRPGYNFLGWYADEGLEQQYAFGSALTDDVTVYAKWDAKFAWEQVEGGIAITAYLDDDPDVVVPAAIDDQNVVALADGAFRENADITTVTFEDGSLVSCVGDEAFKGCTGLTAVTFKSSASLGARAFQGCTSLQTVTLVAGDALTAIPDAAFDGCSKLVMKSLPQGIATIGEYAFRGCADVTAITLPKTLVSVSGQSSPFAGSGLNTVAFEDGTTAVPADMFKGCTALEGVTLPGSVTSVGDYAFQGCSLLSTITLPDGLESIGAGAFQDCAALTGIAVPASLKSAGTADAPAFKGSGLTSAAIAQGMTEVPAYLFQGCESLTGVTLPSGVTSIGDYAFAGCKALSSIDLPDGLKSLGQGTFQDCAKLASVLVPASLTGAGSVDAPVFAGSGLQGATLTAGMTEVPAYLFKGCENLDSVDMSTAGTVTSIGAYAFAGCTSLNPVKLPDALTSIGEGAFQNCGSILEVTLPATVATVGDKAFQGCTQMYGINLACVETLGSQAFQGCSSLGVVRVTKTLTTIGDQAFADCTAADFALYGPRVCTARDWANQNGVTYYPDTVLVTFDGNGGSETASQEIDYNTRATRPEGDPTRSGYTFAGWCTGTNTTTQFDFDALITEDVTVYAGWDALFDVTEVDGGLAITGYRGKATDVVIPETIDDKTVVAIADKAFYQRSDLTSITLPSTVTSIGASAFAQCAITSIDVSHVSSIGKGAFQGCRNLASIDIAEGTALGESAFYRCTGLTTLSVPARTSMGAGAFADCRGLTSVTVKGGVAVAAEAFQNCTSLETVVLEPGVTAVGNDAFSGCASLTGVTLPDSLQTLGEYAFADCTSLASVSVPGGVAFIEEGAFSGCTALSSLNLSYGLESVGDVAFQGCTSLEQVVLPRTVTSVGDAAFFGCSKLGDVQFSDSLAYIGGYAFANCSELSEFYFPSGVTEAKEATFHGCTSLHKVDFGNVKTIDKQAFYGCTALEGVTLSDATQSVGEQAFSGCDKLASVRVAAALTSIDASAFESCDANLTFYGPRTCDARTWAEAAGYTYIPDTVVVTFVCDGFPAVDAQELKYDSDTVTDPNIEATAGYSFSGWYTDEALSQPFTGFGAKLTADLTLYAKMYTVFEYSEVEGGIAITAYNGSDSEVSVPAQIDGKDVVAIAANAFRDNTSMTSVSLPGTVTSVGASAFYGCSSLATLTLPDALTTIGSSAFRGTAISSFTFPAGVTTVGARALSDCASLTDIYVTDALSSISSSAFLNSNVTFHGPRVCYAHTWADKAGVSYVPDTVLVTFESNGGSQIASVDVKTGGTADTPDEPTRDGYAFDDWYADEDLKQKFDFSTQLTENTTVYAKWSAEFEYNVLQGNRGVEIKAYVGSKTDIVIPATIDGYQVKSVIYGAFEGNTKLTSVTVSDGVALEGTVFRKCTSLTKVVLPEGLTEVPSGLFYGCTALTEVQMPSTVTSIASVAFKGCSSLESITLPDNLATIGKDAFKGCSKLSSIHVTSALTGFTDGNPFTNCADGFTLCGPRDCYARTWAAEKGVAYRPDTALVTYKLNGGTGLEDTEYDYGTVFQQPSDPVKPGYAFGGWYTDEQLQSAYEGFGAELTDDVTLYAKWAAEYEYVDLEDGTIQITAYHGTAVNLDVPAAIDGKQVTSIAIQTFQNLENLQTVTIPEGVTTIEKYAFRICNSLTSVRLPSTLTTIGENPFGSEFSEVVVYGVRECYARTWAEDNGYTYIPDTVLVTFVANNGTDNTTSEIDYNKQVSAPADLVKASYTLQGWCTDEALEQAFDFAEPVKKDVTLYAKWAADYEWVEVAGGIQITKYNGTDTDVVVPEAIDGKTVVSVGTAFKENAAITSVVIPGTVTSLDKYAFEKCGSLVKVTLPDTMTSLGNYAFWECEKLADINLPASLTSLGDRTFMDCTSLTSAVIPQGVTEIGYNTFKGCSSLATVEIPSGVRSIQDFAFDHCTKLTSVTIPEGVEYVGQKAFRGCGLTQVRLPASLTKMSSDAFQSNPEGIVFYGPRNCYAKTWAQQNNFTYVSDTVLVTFVTGCDTVLDSQELRQGATVENPGTLARDGYTFTGWYADKACANAFDFSAGITDDVTVYAGWEALFEWTEVEGGIQITKYLGTDADVVVPGAIDGKTVVSVGTAFKADKNITSVVIPSGVTSIDKSAFAQCASLEKVTLPDTVTKLGNYAFWECEKLADINLPASLTDMGDRTFMDCTSLSSVVIPEGVTYVGYNTFKGCTSLAKVKIPSSVTSIEDSAFSGCALTSVVIPEGVQRIGQSAFLNCDLAEVRLPASLTEAAGSAFRGCPEDIVFRGPRACYAKTWAAENGYTYIPDTVLVTFEVDGGTAVEAQELPYNGTMSKPDDPAKTGYTFVGWFSDKELQTEFTAFDQQLQDDLTLYAKWQINSYTVTFVNEGQTYDTQTVEYQACAAAPAQPAKDGYTFQGWFAQDAEVAYDFATPVTGELTLTAVWKINTYTVTFDANGGEDVPSQQVDYNGQAEVPSIAGRPGYSLAGWFTDEALQSAYDFSAPVTADITLHAKWVALFQLRELDGGGVEIVGYLGDATSVYVPEEIDGQKVVGIGERAFRNNTALTSIDVAEGVEYVGAYAFSGCTALKSASLPSSLDSLGNGAFYGCSALESVNIPAGVSTVGTKAFAGCSSLAEVTIPEGVTTVMKSAFQGCGSLAKVNVPGSLTKVGDNAFSGCAEGVTFYGPRSCPARTWAEGQGFAYVPNTVLVTFDSAGGAAVDKQEVAYGTAASEPAPAPTLTGCEFKYWYADDSQTAFDFTQGLTADVELHALWGAASYTVTFTVDGQQYCDSQAVEYGKTADAPETDPSKTGYEFLGWFEDGATEAYDFGAAVTGNVELHAEWKANEYTVTFTVDGQQYKQQGVEYGNTAAEPAAPAKTGHEFLGWFEQDATEAYDFGTAVTGNVELFAQWSADEYTVTFMDGENQYGQAQTVAYGQTAKAPEANPTRDGFAFKGWYLQDSSKAYDFDTPVTGNVTLYAQWVIDSYTVTFTVDGSQYTTQAVKYGQKASAPIAPSKTGYEFLGWYADGAEGAYDFEQVVKGNLELHAEWSANTYMVTFDANGGNGAPEPQSVAYGEQAKQPEQQPTRKGYTFAGWYAEGYSKAYLFSEPVTGDLKLRAKWSLNSYTVTFTVDGAQYATQSVKYGKQATAPAVPTKDGYTFAGWQNADGSAYDFGMAVTGDIQLQASWNAVTCTVTFMSDGTVLSTQSVAYGGTASAPEAPTMLGYDFAGWCSDANLLNSYDFGAAVTGDVTVYAKWTKKSSAVPTSFKDVSSDSWYYSWVMSAASQGLMTGYKDESDSYTGFFGPEDSLTRAQVATVLWRMAGCPDVSGDSVLPDVKGSWAEVPIAWCQSQGIITGYTGGEYAGLFRPDAPVTRAELAVMVYRYAKWAGVDVSGASASAFNRCQDASSVESWAYDAMVWCASAQIINGKELGGGVLLLDPEAGATRAQAAKVLVQLSSIASGAVDAQALYAESEAQAQAATADEAAAQPVEATAADAAAEEVTFDDVAAPVEAAVTTVTTETAVEGTQDAPAEEGSAAAGEPTTAGDAPADEATFEEPVFEDVDAA